MARAVAAATDVGALAQLRAELRARFAASPLGDAAGLAREFEAAYRTLWRRWCNDDKRDVRQVYATGDVDAACRLAEHLLAEDPHDAGALHVLGIIRFSQGDAATAAVLLQRSVSATADAAVLSDLGVMLRAIGRLADAEAAYRRALQLNPAMVQALGNLGNVLLDLASRR